MFNRQDGLCQSEQVWITKASRRYERVIHIYSQKKFSNFSSLLFNGLGVLDYIYNKEETIMKNRKNKYILISKDLQKNLIDFLDEVQLEAAKLNTTDNMHIVNFCSFVLFVIAM